MNDVFVRDKKSIKSMSLTRILLLLPMIIYGLYKNGIFLYNQGMGKFFTLTKPLIFILGSAFVGAFVNIIYEYIIKRKKEKLIDALFSSFHIEYGIILGCVISINTNLLIYFSVLFLVLLISKFINLRVNVIALMFIIGYLIHIFVLKEYVFMNLYESTTNLSLDMFDYFLGRGVGGIASTNVLLLVVAFIIYFITNNNKTNVTISSIVTICLLFAIYGLATNTSIKMLLFGHDYIFILGLIGAEFISSCYTPKGMVIFGVLTGLISFGLYFVIPVLAPYIAILIVSLFHVLIDKYSGKVSVKQLTR